MPDLDLDLDAKDGAWLGRMLVGIGRAIWWLVWDFGCEWLGWTVGWFTCRVVTLGRFPGVAWNEEERAMWWEQLLVILLGWGVLGAIAWWVIEPGA